MHNFKDYLNFSPNPADNAYRLKQMALQEALLAEAKKKKKKTKSEDELADKDYDGDGKLESKKKEYFGSRDKAIKANMAKEEQKEETDLSDLELVEELMESVFDSDDLELLEALIVEKKKWIQKAIKKEGSLRKSMKTKEGKTIPVSKLKKAAKEGGKTGKRARLALTLRKINEEATNPSAELEKHMGVISAHGRNLHDTDHPDRYKFGRAWVDFGNGKFDNADELIKMGADPEAIGNYIKIRTSPEYKEHMEKVQANLDPDFVMGRTITRPDGTKVAPGGWTGD